VIAATASATLATAALSAAIVPAAAVAAAARRNRIGVHGPTTNTLGNNFSETVTGFAAGAANYVASGEQFNKGSGCAATYAAEKVRSDFTPWPSGSGSVHGSFSLVARFGAANAGTHGICSYLIKRSTGKTFAHASLFWKNVSPTTTTTPSPGGKLQPSAVGQGQCQAKSYPDGSVTAQIAIENTTCATAGVVEPGADKAQGAPYQSQGFACTSTVEGAGSTWSSAWTGTYYAYSCVDGAQQVAFNWGLHYSYGG